jgi:hypothetical protein
MNLQGSRHILVNGIEELAKLRAAMPAVTLPITRLVFKSSAANSDVVPCRL